MIDRRSNWYQSRFMIKSLTHRTKRIQ